jgi:2'-5' RNA ligase
MRLFVAADLSDAARQAFAVEQQRIVAALAASSSSPRWVQPDRVHLTLVFLGEVADRLVPAVVESLAAGIAQPPFEIALGGVGVFPLRGAPRVLWLGIAEGAAALGAMQRTLAQRAADLELPLERRAFHPHLTLGRWKQSRPSDREQALKAGRPEVIVRTPVAHATLFQSRLSASGPSYTPLARANLTPPI